MAYVDKRILRAIQSADPDGGEREPTDADYVRFADWAIATYGNVAFQAYRQGGWDDPADWHEGDNSALSEDYDNVQVTGQGALFTLHY